MKCQEKHIYYTEAAALCAAQTYSTDKNYLYHYRCYQCGFFHLTRINPHAYKAQVRRKRIQALYEQLTQLGE